MRSFLLMQLAFNVLILFSLIMLARRPARPVRGTARRSSARDERRPVDGPAPARGVAAPQAETGEHTAGGRAPRERSGRRRWRLPALERLLRRARRAPARTARRGPREAAPSPPAHLADLVAATERRELVAEAELRKRLARYRTGTAG